MEPNQAAKDFYRRNRVRRPRRTSYSPGFGGFGCLIFLVVALLFIGGISFEVYNLVHKNSVTFTVKDKLAKMDCTENSGCKSKYLIFTSEGVYEDTDSLFFFKFNSSDLYNKLEEGKTYNCKTYGFRIPFFSRYPNLVNCEPA